MFFLRGGPALLLYPQPASHYCPQREEGRLGTPGPLLPQVPPFDVSIAGAGVPRDSCLLLAQAPGGLAGCLYHFQGL